MIKNGACHHASKQADNSSSCDIVLESIINNRYERIEQIEVTTVKDVYEKITWESEIKTPKSSNKRISRTPIAMDDSFPKITATTTEISLNGGVFSEHNQYTGDLMNTSDGSVYYEVENNDEGEIENITKNDYTNSMVTQSQVYPVIDDVKQIEVDTIVEYESNYDGDKIENDSRDTATSKNKDITADNKSYGNGEVIGSAGKTSEADDGTIDETKNSISTDHSANSIATDSQHPRYDQFNKLTRKYFKFIHRYHLGDTLPNYFRGQFQMQMRAIGANSLTLGLFGQAGSGKSAFLNSLYSALSGSYVEYSAERRTAIEDDEHGATNQRMELRLTETIVVLDNRATDFSKNSLSEIAKQCGECIIIF